MFKTLKQFFLEILKIKNLNHLKNYLNVIFLNQKMRFLFIGFCNTTINYIFGYLYFKYLTINFIKIILFNFIISINSFLMHKFFTFTSKKIFPL